MTTKRRKPPCLFLALPSRAIKAPFSLDLKNHSFSAREKEMGFGKASRRRRQHQKDIPLIYARHIFCCLRRATFDWPKVAKGQSGRGASAPPPFPTPIPLQTAKHRGDCGPPYWKYPPSSSTVASVSTGGLRCHAAGAGGAGAPPRRGSPEGAISPEKPCFSYPVWIFLYQYYKME